jgi:phosphoadenosine phosphosulfate reductase
MNKVDISLKLMKGLYSETQPNIIAFSGGKDSIVLWHLAMRSELDFKFIYSNTTIDPPGHINFIRENYPNVEIVRPRYSFYQIVEKYGLPTRHRRFCCQHLKEYVGKGCKVFEGLRIDEGVKRGKRLKSLKEPEQCDTRIKNKIHAYPIMHWTEIEIWDYIHNNNLPYPIHYDLGFKRLGCIGCPLANNKQRIIEYKMYPKYVYATIRAIDRNIKAGKSLSKFFNDPYEAFYWWINGLSIEKHKEKLLIDVNYEQQIKNIFPLNSFEKTEVCEQKNIKN